MTKAFELMTNELPQQYSTDEIRSLCRSRVEANVSEWRKTDLKLRGDRLEAYLLRQRRFEEHNGLRWRDSTRELLEELEITVSVYKKEMEMRSQAQA